MSVRARWSPTGQYTNIKPVFPPIDHRTLTGRTWHAGISSCTISPSGRASRHWIVQPPFDRLMILTATERPLLSRMVASISSWFRSARRTGIRPRITLAPKGPADFVTARASTLKESSAHMARIITISFRFAPIANTRDPTLGGPRLGASSVMGPQSYASTITQ